MVSFPVICEGSQLCEHLWRLANSRPADSFLFLLTLAATDTTQTKLFCSCGVPTALSLGSCDSGGSSMPEHGEEGVGPTGPRDISEDCSGCESRMRTPSFSKAAVCFM